MIDLFNHVPMPPVALYFAVNVLLPAVSPVTRYVALAWALRFAPLPTNGTLRAFASDAATAVIPETSNPIKDDCSAVLLLDWDVRVTSAWPDAGTVTVTAGPTVARFA
jgi:hypothetical protein